jgi:hypothetical protein
MITILPENRSIVREGASDELALLSGSRLEMKTTARNVVCAIII